MFVSIFQCYNIIKGEKMEKYERFKKWLEINRPKIITGLCFILVFVLGFGTGRYDKENFSKRNSVVQNNYNTKTTVKPKDEKPTGEQVKKEEVQGAEVKKENCLIKGNISAQGKKIYHVKGGSFYERTNPEQCFNTEDEARALGFIKSSR